MGGTTLRPFPCARAAALVKIGMPHNGANKDLAILMMLYDFVFEIAVELLPQSVDPSSCQLFQYRLRAH